MRIPSLALPFICIDNGGNFPSLVLNSSAEYAIVCASPTEYVEVTGIAREFGGQLAGVFQLLADKPLGVAKLKDLRIGWERVKKQLQVATPHVKRILYLCDTKALRVLIPGLTGDVQDSHGTLFKVDDWIVVPSFEAADWELEHVRPWMKRDIQRTLRLTRPAEPLPYGVRLPPVLAGTVVVDLETSGLNADTDIITSLGLQWSDHDRAIITGTINIRHALQKLMNSPGITALVFHNGQYDLGFLGADFRATFYSRIRCTFIRAKARGELVCGLKHLAAVYTACPGNYAWHVPGEHHSFDTPAYICEDLDATWRLHKLWKDENTDIVTLMEQCIVMAADQTSVGSHIDLDQLDTLLEETNEELEKLEVELTQEYGCSPSQTEELAKTLVARGYKLNAKTASGKDALTAEVLEELGLEDILEYRQLSKLNSAFIGKMRSLMRANGKLPHHQTMMGADTGRSTMSNFNWQQLPRKGPGKKLVVSRFVDGFISQVDLSQAELRIAAYLSNDEAFAKVLMMSDAHRYNASIAFDVAYELVTDDMRNAAKTVIFRLIYGGGAITESQKRVERYMRSSFPQLFKYLETAGKKAMNLNSVTDPYGKTRNLLKVYDYRGKWGVKRAGINSPVQGVASHAALEITLYLWDLSSVLLSKVLFGVHDSVVSDVHPDEVEDMTRNTGIAFQAVGMRMKRLFPLAELLPLTGELQYGRSWADTKTAKKILISSHGGVLSS